MTSELIFDGFEIHSEARRVLVRGKDTALGARAYDILLFLAENRNRVVTKAELMDHAWPGLAVEESNLTVQISALRKVLGKDVIATVTGVGYRFTQKAADTQEPPKGPPLPDKPSLAVLPFANHSGDPSQEYFIDGVVGDIINGLSRVRAFFVIAQNSSFTFKGKNEPLAQIGEELGVRYILEGSFQQAGDMLRVSTQLVEAATGRTVWSERFSGSRSDVFALQDEITARTVAAIEPRLSYAESERVRRLPTESLQAYELCLRALPNVNLMTSHQQLNEALALIETAIVIDPNYSFAKALHGWAYSMAYASRWISFDAARAAAKHNQDALYNHRDDPMTLAMAGHTAAYLERDPEAGIAALELALQLNPNCTQALGSLGWLAAYTNDVPRSLACFRDVMALGPLDPFSYAWISGIGHAYLCVGRFEEAVQELERSYRLFPDFISTLSALITVYAALGRVDAAKAAAAKLLIRQPNITIRLQMDNTPFRGAVFRDAMEKGMRIAGIPET